MAVTGPAFIALQVRDLERAATFCETHHGLRRIPSDPPGAVVFDTAPAKSTSASRSRTSTWTLPALGRGSESRCGCTLITPKRSMTPWLPPASRFKRRP